MSWINELGYEIDPPYRDPETSMVNERRATIIFWHYMNQAGIPIRDIASCFSVGKSLVHRYIKEIPADVKDSYRSDDFVGRLRAAVNESGRPKSHAELRSVMQAARAIDMQRCASV
jgi:hypothetical protein